MEFGSEYRGRCAVRDHGQLTTLTALPVAVEPGRHLAAAQGGSGPPRVLFDGGAFAIYADGANLVRALAARGVPSVTYTRANLSGSDDRAGPPTPDAHGDDMLRFLNALGQTGPCVFVGHSMGALRLHRLAQVSPDRVAGLVLVDGIVPSRGWQRRLRALAAILGPVERTLPAFCRTANAYPNKMQLEGRERADKLRSVYSAAHLRASRAEFAAAARAQISADHDRPMVLMPAGRVARGSESLAARSGAGLIDMGDWGHASVLSPKPCEVIAETAASMV